DDVGFLDRVQPPNQLSAVILATGVFVAIVLPVTLGVAVQSQQFALESPPVLFGMLNPFQFYGWWKLLFFFNAYLLTVILIRHCVAVRTINYVVASGAVTPRAFHPDGANGLGAIGQYAVRTGW